MESDTKYWRLSNEKHKRVSSSRFRTTGVSFPAGDIEVTTVPEPGTIVMLPVGMAGLLIYRKRR